MKLLNRGKREIHGETHVDRNEDGTFKTDYTGKEIKPVPFVLKPNTAIDFDEQTGHKLKKLFKGELVTFEDLQRQFDGTSLVAANAPEVKRMHQNEAPVSSPSSSDLSDEEQLVIAKMRASSAKPVELPPAPKAEDVQDLEGAESKDLSHLSEEELEKATAPTAKQSLADKVKAAMHGGNK
jgi:hypothetical protein